MEWPRDMANDNRRMRKDLEEAHAEIERLRAERKNCPPVSESEYVKRLEDDVEYLLEALQRVADHQPGTPGLYFDSHVNLIESACATARDALRRDVQVKDGSG